MAKPTGCTMSKTIVQRKVYPIEAIFYDGINLQETLEFISDRASGNVKINHETGKIRFTNKKGNVHNIDPNIWLIKDPYFEGIATLSGEKMWKIYEEVYGEPS